MKYKIWLLMLNVSNATKLKLLDKYNNEENIYLNYEKIIRDDILFRLVKDKENNKVKLMLKAEELIEWMAKNYVGFISFNDEEYPVQLKEINEPPYGLFYKGNINLLMNKNVAIVGSRVCTSYGIQVSKLLTKELISYNITIISGGAKGIDSIAHKTAVEENGKTVVVLGCGIDITYPPQNYSLFKEVEKSGLIISEFLPGTNPNPYNFPRRNRIISGLSELVIVVEASDKSGSLITAQCALDQGKNVMAVPGSVFAKGSNGCNKLIRDGAQMFCTIEDVYTLLKLDFNKNEGILSPIKKKILSIIAKEPIHIDEIFKKSYIDREALFKVLFEMQIRNEIVSLPGNYYAKIT